MIYSKLEKKEKKKKEKWTNQMKKVIWSQYNFS